MAVFQHRPFPSFALRVTHGAAACICPRCRAGAAAAPQGSAPLLGFPAYRRWAPCVLLARVSYISCILLADSFCISYIFQQHFFCFPCIFCLHSVRISLQSHACAVFIPCLFVAYFLLCSCIPSVFLAYSLSILAFCFFIPCKFPVYFLSVPCIFLVYSFSMSLFLAYSMPTPSLFLHVLKYFFVFLACFLHNLVYILAYFLYSCTSLHIPCGFLVCFLHLSYFLRFSHTFCVYSLHISWTFHACFVCVPIAVPAYSLRISYTFLMLFLLYSLHIPCIFFLCSLHIP